jgi:hypothetical protein
MKKSATLKNKKLRLHRETLRALGERDLAGVAAGATTNYGSAEYGSCGYCGGSHYPYHCQIP